jgi:hypothetical protein
MGPHDPVPVVEKWWQIAAGDIAVFIDCGGYDCTALFKVPGRVIGSTAKKRNSIGGL